MRIPHWLLAMVAGGLGSAGVCLAQAPPAAPLAVLDIMARSQQAFSYAGTDMSAKVRMELVAATGQRRTRVLTMLRRNVPGGTDQKYFLYFHEPGDVRRMAFIVWKYPERDDDRWIFIPAVNMVRRVAASDSRSSFVGSDFTYEDVSGRDLSLDTHTLLRQERLGDADCYVVESVPKTPADYARKLSWIDATTFLPRKEEYYDVHNQLQRAFTADEITEIAAADGSRVPTVVRRTMKNARTGHRTEVTFASVAYGVGLDDAIFSERSLQSPPARWIK